MCSLGAGHLCIEEEDVVTYISAQPEDATCPCAACEYERCNRPAFQTPVFEKALQSSRFEQLLDQMRELHRQKRSDYTGDRPDILHNYRTAGELAGIGIEKAIFSRLAEKVIRISGILRKEGDTQVKDETITDTCLDLAIIALLLRVALEEGS